MSQRYCKLLRMVTVNEECTDKCMYPNIEFLGEDLNKLASIFEATITV